MIHVEDHAAHCRMGREITVMSLGSCRVYVRCVLVAVCWMAMSTERKTSHDTTAALVISTYRQVQCIPPVYYSLCVRPLRTAAVVWWYVRFLGLNNGDAFFTHGRSPTREGSIPRSIPGLFLFSGEKELADTGR